MYIEVYTIYIFTKLTFAGEVVTRAGRVASEHEYQFASSSARALVLPFPLRSMQNIVTNYAKIWWFVSDFYFAVSSFSNFPCFSWQRLSCCGKWQTCWHTKCVSFCFCFLFFLMLVDCRFLKSLEFIYFTFCLFTNGHAYVWIGSVDRVQIWRLRFCIE